jgi:hypothetical protein
VADSTAIAQSETVAVCDGESGGRRLRVRPQHKRSCLDVAERITFFAVFSSVTLQTRVELPFTLKIP